MRPKAQLGYDWGSARGMAVSATSATIGLQLDGAEAAENWRRAGDDLPRDRAFEAIGPEAGFSANYMERRVGEIVVADVRGAPLMLRERPETSGPITLLQAVVEGQPVFRSAEGESVTLKPGQLIVRRCLPGAVVWSDRPARVVTAFVAQHLLAPRFATAAALNDYTLLVDNALPPRLLYSFVVGLADAEDGLASARGGVRVPHVVVAHQASGIRHHHGSDGRERSARQRWLLPVVASLGCFRWDLRSRRSG